MHVANFQKTWTTYKELICMADLICLPCGTLVQFGAFTYAEDKLPDLLHNPKICDGHK